MIDLSWVTVLSLASPVKVERKGVNRFLGKRAREFMIVFILASWAERALIFGVILCRRGFV